MRKLTRQMILFALIRAIAVAIAVAIPFGLDLPEAAWMPIATLVAMKPDLEQSTRFAEQRLVGAILGALVAAVLLLPVDNTRVLEVAVVLTSRQQPPFTASTTPSTPPRSPPPS